jgi:hypoxanthine-DNA glycosylase
MSQVIGVDLVPLEYPARLATLLAHGVGLWDVIAEARRDGSLDSNIKQHRGNDLPGLIQSLPALTTIGFNGRTAAKVGRKQIATLADQLNLIELPSSSPAYTMALARSAGLAGVTRQPLRHCRPRPAACGQPWLRACTASGGRRARSIPVHPCAPNRWRPSCWPWCAPSSRARAVYSATTTRTVDSR